MHCWRTSALAASLLIALVSPTLANLVTDPGFESCPTVPPPPGWSGTAGCNANHAHTGSWAAGFELNSTLSQSISTTPGATYDFSFWVSGINLPTPDQFTASFGSDQVLDLVNVTPSTYTFEDFTVAATAAITTIAFAGTTTGDSAWLLDDVSVTAVTVPEPASLSLLAASLLGLVGLGAVRRRRSAN
jgi:hypothetical protein